MIPTKFEYNGFLKYHLILDCILKYHLLTFFSWEGGSIKEKKFNIYYFFIVRANSKVMFATGLFTLTTVVKDS